MRETWVQSLGQEDPLEKGMAIHSLFLPGEVHGQRSMAGYSPCGQKESDMTEQLTHTHTLSKSLTLEWVLFQEHICNPNKVNLGTHLKQLAI